MAAAEYRTVTSSRIFLISISLSFSRLSKKARQRAGAEYAPD